MGTPQNIPDIQHAVLAMAASVFEIQADRLKMETSPDTLDNWDSLNHLKLITAIETEFGIRLPMSVVLEIDSIRSLVRAVEDCTR